MFVRSQSQVPKVPVATFSSTLPSSGPATRFPIVNRARAIVATCVSQPRCIISRGMRTAPFREGAPVHENDGRVSSLSHGESRRRMPRMSACGGEIQKEEFRDRQEFSRLTERLRRCSSAHFDFRRSRGSDVSRKNVSRIPARVSIVGNDCVNPGANQVFALVRID